MAVTEPHYMAQCPENREMIWMGHKPSKSSWSQEGKTESFKVRKEFDVGGYTG